MWVRGLKLLPFPIPRRGVLVAPHVGAWIETDNEKIRCLGDPVAPHVGAWIETRT